MKIRISILLIVFTCLLCSCAPAASDTSSVLNSNDMEKIAESLSTDIDYERHIEKLNITGISGEISAVTMQNGQLWFAYEQVLYYTNTDGSNVHEVFGSLPENTCHIAFGANQEVYVGADNAIYIFKTDGELLSQSAFDYGQTLIDLVSMPDENPAALLWNGNEHIICSIEKENFGTEIDFDIPELVVIRGITIYNGFSLLTLDDGLYVSSGKSTMPILSWIDIGCAENNGICLAGISENNDIFLLNRLDGSIYTLSEPVFIEKTILNLATVVNLAGSDLEKAVISFNNSNREYKIKVTTYDSVELLNRDIIAGNVPDLINISSIIPFDSYSAKGLFEDLNPYFESDGEVQLIPQIQKAMLSDGKLYFASPGFHVMTLIGIPDFVGSEYGWTYDEMKHYLAEASKGATVLAHYWTKEHLLQFFLYQNMDWTVDWQTGRALFDSADFKELLEFVNTARENSGEIMDEIAQIMVGKQLVIHHTFVDIINFAYIDNMFEGKSVFKGFPSSKKSSGVLYPANYMIAMTSVCAEKPAAWSFIRQALLDDPLFQIIPAIKSKFDSAVDIAMAEGDEELGVPPLTKQQYEKLLELIDGIGPIVQQNLDLQRIINEEVPAYFAGQKSVEEVCEIIQARAQNYVGERSG